MLVDKALELLRRRGDRGGRVARTRTHTQSFFFAAAMAVKIFAFFWGASLSRHLQIPNFGGAMADKKVQ